MARDTVNEQEKAAAIEGLREMLKPGDTVYTILRHVSQSGTTRRISCIVIYEGEPRLIDYKVSKIIGLKRSPGKEGVVIGGSGMNMGFAIVYDLSYYVFGDAYALNQRWL
jgi:hypothetical protein